MMLLKLVFNFGKKIISKCLDQYFQPVVQIHNYPIKFAGNFAALFLTKLSLHISYDMPEVNFGMKSLKKLTVVIIEVTIYLNIE